MLQRVFADRQQATAAAVAPLIAWCDGDADLAALRRALTRAVDGYVQFLVDRPAFRRFIGWEELAGAERLRTTPYSSTALTDAFTAVRAVAARRGLRRFDVDDAVVLWVSLTFAPMNLTNTFLARLDRDLSDPTVRRRHVRFAVEHLMVLLAGARG